MSDYGGVSALAILPIVALLPLALVYQRMIARGNRFVTVKGKAYAPKRSGLGRWRTLAYIGVGLYFSCSLILPFFVLAATSLLPYLAALRFETLLPAASLNNYIDVLRQPNIVSAITNTVVIAVVVATALTVISALISWCVVRSKAPGRGVIDRLAFMPLALSNIMIGLALIFVYTTLRFIPVYGTIWIIVIAHFTAFLTFATRTLNGALLQLHPELEESARASGAGWSLTMRKITVPLVGPALLVIWIWVLSHSMRELSAALILQSGGNSTVPTVLWASWNTNQEPMAAALGCMLMLVLVGFAIVWDRLNERNSITSS